MTNPNFLVSSQLTFECRFGHDLICLSDHASELLRARDYMDVAPLSKNSEEK